jgi:hypothetical protein
MKYDRNLKFTPDNGDEIHLYDQKMISGQFWVKRPPRSVYGVLWMAWTTMNSGHSRIPVENRMSVKKIIKHLRSVGISADAAKWAAEKANEHRASRMGFMKLADHYQGTSEDAEY